MKERLPRKLAAILYADVAGYSRLTGEDEEGTHRRLSEYLDLMSGAIEQHQGKVVHYAGDAVLADFGTVTEALTSAAAIQRELADRNRTLPEERKVRFRIGVNLGEVIVDRDDIYGDGVNVAARLEGLADAGGICISESVHTALGSKLPLKYEDIGEQHVKNITKPIRAYKVVMNEEERETNLPESTTLELPDKPSIAVLPFTNMSGDPEQEYFSDGLTEDIITELSRFRDLFVIARNSTFIYRNKPVDVNQISRELGVRYVLEGSVRKVGNRIRVNAQLIDAKTGSHLWADRYDRELEDIFAIQDEITTGIVAATGAEISRAEYARIARKLPRNLSAWDCYQQGVWHAYRITKDDNGEARRLFQRAVELDPTSPRPYEGLAGVGFSDVVNQFAHSREDTLAAAKRDGEKALSLDDEDAAAHAVYGRILVILGKSDEAIRELTRAIKLNPNLSEAYRSLGFALQWAGRPEEAIKECDKALRLSPRDPAKWLNWNLKAFACFQAGRYEEAIRLGHQVLQYRHEHRGMCELIVVAEAELGREDRLQAAKAELLRRFPDYSIRASREYSYSHWLDMRIPQRYLDRLFDGLRMAGLPE